MTIPDLNVLLYAINGDTPNHGPAKTWLDSTLAAGEPIGLAWLVVVGFLRLATSDLIFRRPLTVDEAISVVDGWLSLPHVSFVEPTAAHFSLLSGLLRQRGTAGNLTNDAHLAAVAVEHRARLVTFDGGFLSFQGLNVTLLRPQAS